jgi:hypothetical protein
MDACARSEFKPESAGDCGENGQTQIYDKLYYESHREENAEYYREYNKYYRETHYLQIKSKARKNVECDCGCTIKRCSMTYHKNSKKHLKLLKEITNSNII